MTLPGSHLVGLAGRHEGVVGEEGSDYDLASPLPWLLPGFTGSIYFPLVRVLC